ncbi:MAG: DUF1800 domain-containing protein [Steroidobacteraceae bacterium]
MTAEFAAAIAANRFGLGARPGELAAISTDPRSWLSSQVSGGAPLLPDAALQSTPQILAGAAPIVRELQAARQARRQSAAQPGGPGDQQLANTRLAMRLPQYLRPIYRADALARFEAAITTGRPFAERLVHFWSNHFAVSVDKVAVLGIAGSFEREAIRPHVFGRFSQMLLAAQQHPAMLLYLDNQQSIGPDSDFARRAATRGRRLGLNENLARETLELHTLGVDAGYTQADVTNFSKVLTGWSIGGGRGRLADGTPGTFMFREELHEPGAQTVFGRRYGQSGVDQGIAVLMDLAASRATARHLATKLAQHFIADEPPPAAIDRMARAYERSDGDLSAVYAALIEAPQAWHNAVAKFKTPGDYVISLCRGLALPTGMQPRALAALALLGQRPFAPGSPAGWPDDSADWDGASELMQRIELADAIAQKLGDRRDAMMLAPQLLGGALTAPTRVQIARAATPAQALTLLLTAPEFLRR